MPSASHAHALFQRYPLAGQVQLSTGPAPMPYHIYAGHGVFVGGTADLAAVRILLKSEQLQTLITTNGRALMGVWIADFTDASLGPHHELQFSLFTARESAPALPAHPLAVLQALSARQETRMLCHGLWNNTETVVAYNREVLTLHARQCHSQITAGPKALAFEFTDQSTGRPILSGKLHAARRAPVQASFALARLVGFGLSQRLMAQPWIEMKIVNPIGLSPRNNVALAGSHSTVNFVRYFEPSRDHLIVADETYRALNFQPQFVQHLAGIKFVYLNPQAE